MTTAPNWLDIGYDEIDNAAIAVVQRTRLNFPAGGGLLATDNPTLGTTDVTATGANTPSPPATTVTGSSSMAAPQTNVVIPIDTTGGAVDLTFTGTPAPGVRVTFIDATKMWAVHPFTFTAQSGALARDPGNLAGPDASSITATLAGASFSIIWVPTVGTGGTWLDG